MKRKNSSVKLNHSHWHHKPPLITEVTMQVQGITDLQEMRLVSQRNGLSERYFERIGRDASQEGHGVRAAEKRMVLSGLSRYRLLILILQGGACAVKSNKAVWFDSRKPVYAAMHHHVNLWVLLRLVWYMHSVLNSLWLVSSSFSCSESSLSRPSSSSSRFLK